MGKTKQEIIFLQTPQIKFQTFKNICSFLGKKLCYLPEMIISRMLLLNMPGTWLRLELDLLVHI